MRSRARLVQYQDGRIALGFENSSVYQDATDAFEAAQRSIVATIPGSVFRYINAGPNASLHESLSGCTVYSRSGVTASPVSLHRSSFLTEQCVMYIRVI
jgi:hypothetical protein